jgi:tetratricopeptide (TPR) repeat protein
MNAEDYFNRGVAYLNSGDYRDAISDFTEALRLAPDSEQIKRNLSVCYHKSAMGKSSSDSFWTDSKIEDYTMSLRFDPSGDAGTFFNRGMVYLKRGKKGDLAMAIADFEMAVKLDPQQADYHKKLKEAGATGKEAFRDKGPKFEKIAALTDALQRNPANAEAYFERGMAFNGIGMPDQAVADINMAKGIDPNESRYREGWLSAESAKSKKKVRRVLINVGIVVVVVGLIAACIASC